MAENEQIGGVSIGITGDYSALMGDFARAQQVAAQAGQGIASALDVAMQRADGLSASVEGAAGSIGLLGQAAASAGGPIEAADTFIAQLNKDIDQLFGADKAVTAIGEGAAKATPELEGLSTDLGEVKKASHEVGEEWGRDQEKIDAAIKSSRQEFKQFTGDLKTGEAAMQELGNSIQNGLAHPLQFAGQQAKAFVTGLGAVGVVAVGAAVGVGALANEAFNLVKEFGAAAEETGNLADRLNLTFTQTRELQEMAQIAGVSVNGLQMASFRLAEALEDASGSGKKVATALRDMGVQGQSSGELLTGFLQKLAEIPDDTERIAKAHDVMGRASQQMLPLIKNYGDLQAAVRSLGNSLDEDGAKKLMKVDDELDKLNIAWNRLKQAMAVKLTPTIEFVVQGAEVLLGGIGGSNAGSIAQLKEVARIQQAAIESAKSANAAIGGYFGTIAAGQKAAADDWVHANEKTVSVMKETLAATESELKQLRSRLSGADPDRQADQQKYSALLSKESQLHADIEAATKKQHSAKEKLYKLTEKEPFLVAMLAEEEGAHKKIATAIVQEITAWQGLTGQKLSYSEVFARNTKEATENMRRFGEFAQRDAPIVKSALDLANDAGKSLGEGMRDIREESQKNYVPTALERMNDLFRELGITTEESAHKAYTLSLEAANLAAKLYAEGKVAAGNVTAAAEEVAKSHKKLQEIVTGTSTKMGATQKEMYREAQAAARRLFDSLESGLAKNIVDWKGWGETLTNIFKTLAQNLLQIMLKVALDPMQRSLGTFLQNSGGIGGAMSKLFGGGGVTGAMPAGYASPSMAALIPVTSANTGATVANTGGEAANTGATVADTGATIADAAATSVNAGATIADAIATHANTVAMGVRTATEVSSRVIYTTTETANTVATGANTAALGALTAAISAASGIKTAGGIANSAGGAGGGGGGGGGSAGSAGGVMGAINMVSGVVTAISSVVGNFQMYGMNKSLDIIVKHTLQCANDLANVRVDLWSQYNHMYERLGEVWNTLKEMGGMKGGSSGGGSLISFTNTTFNGGASQADADRIGQAIVLQLQRAGAIR